MFALAYKIKWISVYDLGSINETSHAAVTCATIASKNEGRLKRMQHGKHMLDACQEQARKGRKVRIRRENR